MIEFEAEKKRRRARKPKTDLTRKGRKITKCGIQVWDPATIRNQRQKREEPKREKKAGPTGPTDIPGLVYREADRITQINCHGQRGGTARCGGMGHNRSSGN